MVRFYLFDITRMTQPRLHCQYSCLADSDCCCKGRVMMMSATHIVSMYSSCSWPRR